MNIIKDEDFRDYIANDEKQSIKPASDFVDEAMDSVMVSVQLVIRCLGLRLRVSSGLELVS
jgi:hypothetical protein